ncbi:MAG: hypothetical protein HY777_07990 [Betaproteobacteria bacterium]|nr:hypothetical protein [Betaproteobacteria bacterium]
MPSILTSPRFYRKKAILGKVEATVETDERNLEIPYMGNSGKIIAGHWVKLSFETAAADPTSQSR